MDSNRSNQRRSARSSREADRRSVDGRSPRQAYSRDRYGTSRTSTSSRTSSRSSRDSNAEETSSSASQRAERSQYAQLRARRNRKRKITIACIIAAVVVVVGAGAAFAYYQVLSGNLHAGVDDDLRSALVETDLANEPFYLLLMGTDGSSDRAASEEYAGDQFRSDSLILTRIDPVDKKVTMVSISRDTLVDMGEYGQNKINAAHALGGPALSVETVSELAGVPISHYAEINFDGFKDIVDALGGVEVDVPIEIDDDDAGGYLAAGPQTLNGDQALILCRSRHAYEEYGAGDSYRAANQRLVLSAIAKKILSADVATMASTVQALSQYVTTDLEITDIVGLAQTLQGLDPSTDIYSAMEPTTSQYLGDVWYEVTDEAAWKEMMSRVDSGLPPTEEDVVDELSGTVLATAGTGQIDPSDTGSASRVRKFTNTVAVRNGNGTTGVGTEAATRIEERGFQVEVGNANSFDYENTVVVYTSQNQADAAAAIVEALGVGTAQMNDGEYLYDTDILVVLGADFSLEQ